LKTKWNPFFKIFGYLLKVLFSNRIEQLNIPMSNNKNATGMNSNIIHLIDKNTKKLKRTIWLRIFKETNQVVYSGVYQTCTIPSGIYCIKAMFPLPNGNATVILQPSVSDDGELILNSAGRNIGDSGFYFLLKDKNGNSWAKYVRSFKDSLTVSFDKGEIKANQIMTFYGFIVLSFEYQIKKLHTVKYRK